MNDLTRFFLVLLRLAIGWHFLVEGVDKIQSVRLGGPTETGRPWTSEPYLREASGPFAPFFRREFGDPDQAALDRLTLRPADDQDPAHTPAVQRLAPALSADWDAYFDRFGAYYNLDDAQRNLARIKLDQSKENAVHWLLGQRGRLEVKKSYPSGTIEVKETPAQRIEEYRQKVQELRDIETRELPAFERDVWKSRLRTLKADVTRMRSELLNEISAPMKEALRSVLNDAQKKMEPMPEAPRPHWWGWDDKAWVQAFEVWGAVVVGLVLLLSLLGEIALNHGREYTRLDSSTWGTCALLVLGAVTVLAISLGGILYLGQSWAWSRRTDWLLIWGAAAVAVLLLVSLLTRQQCAARGVVIWGWGRWLLAWVGALVGAGLCLGLIKASMIAWADWTQQEWLDWLVAFGLCAVGACLLLGLMTRSACVGGALLLLMFYVTMPALPGVPDNPRAEGHYLFINKNVIEMLALLALATTASGRWAGLDGLVRVLNPVRWFVRPVGSAARTAGEDT
jgi:uncharacterized membrane protein YphA (DoxX/SURF4 family)